MLLIALGALFATRAAAQTGSIDDDVQRAQKILTRLATENLAQGPRASLAQELAGIEAHEYVIQVKLVARKYTAGSGYYPVTVSKPGLLEPPATGRIEMPKGVARRAKSQLNPAYATIRVRVLAGDIPRAVQKLDYVWIKVDGTVWRVVSDDPRLPPEQRIQDDSSTEEVTREEGSTSGLSPGRPLGSVPIRVPEQYPTIQEAVDAAPGNGVILVSAGTYEERVVITAPVTIRGAGRDRTVLTYGVDSVVWLNRAGGVRLLDLTIDGQGTAEAAVRCDMARIWMERVAVVRANHGVFFDYGGGTLLDVVVTDIERLGIELNGATATVENCRISAVKGTAIHGINTAASILRCEITGSREGIGLGGGGTTAIIDGNRIQDCGLGLALFADCTATVRRNLITRNGTGVNIDRERYVDLGEGDDPGLNQIFGNANDDLVHTPVIPTDLLPAQGNWWGSADGGKHRIKGPVDQSRWLNRKPAPVLSDATSDEWSPLLSPSPGNQVDAIAITSVGTIHTAGAGGGILSSSDGGRTWQSRQPSLAIGVDRSKGLRSGAADGTTARQVPSGD
jgi:hypothetical protein